MEKMTSVTTVTELPRVCALVLNYNSYQDTVEYVEVLRRQQRVNLHILIVDNCSPNESYAVLSKAFSGAADVTVLKSQHNGGYAYGNNYGLRAIEHSPYDYVLVTNNDIEIDDPELICKLVMEYRQLESPAFISGVAHNKGMPAKYPAWKLPRFIDDVVGSLRCTNLFFRSRIAYDLKGEGNTVAVDCLPGCFFLGAKEVFFRIGLMDENTFLYMEEVILAHKAKALGMSNYLVKSLRYEHAESKTISSVISQGKMRKYLIQSRLYYYSHYHQAGAVKTGLLRFLFCLWRVENRFYGFLRNGGR